MTGTAHEVWGVIKVWMGGYWSFPRPAQWVEGDRVWSLRRGARGGIRSN